MFDVAFQNKILLLTPRGADRSSLSRRGDPCSISPVSLCLSKISAVGNGRSIVHGAWANTRRAVYGRSKEVFKGGVEGGVWGLFQSIPSPIPSYSSVYSTLFHSIPSPIPSYSTGDTQ